MDKDMILQEKEAEVRHFTVFCAYSEELIFPFHSSALQNIQVP